MRMAALRRVLGPDGRAVNLLVLGACTALLCGAAYLVWNPGPGWIALLVVAAIALLHLVSGRFSVRFLRSLLVSLVVLVLAALVNSGREETSDKRLKEGRAEATELAARLDIMKAEPSGASQDPESLLKAIEERLKKEPSDPKIELVTQIVRELRALLAGDADKAKLDDVKGRIPALLDPPVEKGLNSAVNAVTAALGVPSRPLAVDAEAAVQTLCDAAGGVLPDLADAGSPSRELAQSQSQARPAAAAPHPPPNSRLCTPETVNRTAGEKRSDEAEKPGAGRKSREAEESDEVAEKRAIARVEIARYGLALASTDDARKAARQEIVDAQQALARAARDRTLEPEGLGVLDALREGASAAVVRATSLGLERGPRVPLALNVVVWAVLGGLGLLLYRRLERRASKGGLGPVAVEDDKTASVEGEQFRTYLLNNIPDPGAVPGADALLPLTDLLAAAPAPGVKGISTVIKAALSIVGQKHGYTVTFKNLDAAEKPAEKGAPQPSPPATAEVAAAPAAGTEADKPPANKTRIVVRVATARTGALIRQTVVAEENKEEAIRMAAYWAAAVVLERSDLVPQWARWSPETSRSLAAFFAADDAARRETASPDTTGDAAATKDVLAQIEKALAAAPTSGVLALLAAHQNALAGCHLRAFELALRTRALNGCFVAARYRLAVSASLVASDVKANWLASSFQQRERVLAALARSGGDEDDDLASALRTAASDRQAATVALCQFGLSELDACKRLLRIRSLLLNSLRRSERSYWLSLFQPLGAGVTRRSQFRSMMAAARPAIQRRAGQVVDPVEDEGTFWQVTYNLACDHAIRAGQGPGNMGAADAALDCLETAIERPDSHQLGRRWVNADPDLKDIRQLDRFKQFVADLPDERSRHADEA